EWVSAAPPKLRVKPTLVQRLPPGIPVAQHASHGWSHLVTLVKPRLAAGAVDSLPDFAQRYAAMFQLTILANVKKSEGIQGDAYILDRIAMGFAMSLGSADVVITPETANQFGAELGMIDRRVLAGNIDCLDEVYEIVRTPQVCVFDAKSNMLRMKEHRDMTLRHFVWVSSRTGNLGFLVWLLDRTGDDEYRLAESAFQLLPPSYVEDRQIHVSDGGWLSSIPTPDRFALVQTPPGRAIPFSKAMATVAAKSTFEPADVAALVTGVNESLRALTTSQ
ncbi:MAG: hypothetical protein AAGD07_09440, partial [Planctomycetota bacterium]